MKIPTSAHRFTINKENKKFTRANCSYEVGRGVTRRLQVCQQEGGRACPTTISTIYIHTYIY
eukprot:c24041_g1_i2 orf=1-183(-)